MGDEVKVSVRLPAQLVSQIDQLAALEHRTRSGQIQHLLAVAVRADRLERAGLEWMGFVGAGETETETELEPQAGEDGA